MNLRSLADPVGFAHTADQMQTLMQRIDTPNTTGDTTWRVAISPHDDYTYVGDLYPALLSNIRARTVILFGVAHKARTLGLENELIFDSFTHWRGPFGNVKVSPIREEIIAALPEGSYQINDEMQAIEHSVEAIVPFLQYYNRDVEIVSILVPAMPYSRMEEVAAPLAEAIGRAATQRGWNWGEEYAIVISTDAVHYGDEEWGGRNFADFGTDESGYREAVAYEQTIITECLTGSVTPAKIERFTKYTVRDDDFREYKWTWCGRYSVPCGLLTAYRLQHFLDAAPLHGSLVGYGTSIDGRAHIPVDDIGMGVTAPATMRHWVGYASVGYGAE
jgi:AmmeMemoRadiSam system protein B